MDSDHSGTQVLPRPKRSSSLDPPASRWALASVQDKSLFAGNEQVKGFFDILMSGDRGEREDNLLYRERLFHETYTCFNSRCSVMPETVREVLTS